MFLRNILLAARYHHHRKSKTPVSRPRPVSRPTPSRPMQSRPVLRTTRRPLTRPVPRQRPRPRPRPKINYSRSLNRTRIPILTKESKRARLISMQPKYTREQQPQQRKPAHSVPAAAASSKKISFVSESYQYNPQHFKSQTINGWFVQLSPIFVITIRPERWKNALNRYMPMQDHLIKWDGTNGYDIDPIEWKAEGYLTNDSRFRSRGQMGCYDSHYRIWERMVQLNMPYALIFEDDANLVLTKENMHKIDNALNQLNRYDPHWELFFLGRSKLKEPIKRYITKDLVVPARSWGCFAYALSLHAARKLVTNAIPMKHAVDVFVFDEAEKMRTYAMNPSLFFVVPVVSDTNNIK